MSSSATLINGAAAATAAGPANQANPLYQGILINGKPATPDANGQLQLPQGSKVQIQFRYDAGVLGQGPAEASLTRFSGQGAPANLPTTTPAQLKKDWQFKDETTEAGGKAPKPGDCGGLRYQTISFAAPKSADGTGLALNLSKPGSPEQTLRFMPVAAVCGPISLGPAPTPQPTQPGNPQLKIGNKPASLQNGALTLQPGQSVSVAFSTVPTALGQGEWVLQGLGSQPVANPDVNLQKALDTTTKRTGAGPHIMGGAVTNTTSFTLPQSAAAGTSYSATFQNTYTKQTSEMTFNVG